MFGSPRSLLVALLAFALALPSIVGCGTLAHAQETPPERPNVVFILADDLDKRLLTSHLSDYPNISRLAANGTTFSGAFVTNALCCPSRATMLTGQYSHNHGVMTNDPPEGGAPAFRPLEPKALPVWLDDAGYATGYVGKYLNNYDGTYEPPGWDEWKAITDGDPVELEPGQGTDLFSDQADAFVRRHAGAGAVPFYLQVGTLAPHKPAVPYARHTDLFPGEKTPQPRSFN